MVASGGLVRRGKVRAGSRVNGLLVPAEDVEGLAAAMLSLMDDAEARRRMGRWALETVRPYSPEVIAAEWASLYADLVRSPIHAAEGGW